MSRAKPRSLAAISAEVLAEVERAERVKQAELATVGAAGASHRSDLGQLLHKVAEELQCSSHDVTYEDLHAFVGGQL